MWTAHALITREYHRRLCQLTLQCPLQFLGGPGVGVLVDHLQRSETLAIQSRHISPCLQEEAHNLHLPVQGCFVQTGSTHALGVNGIAVLDEESQALNLAVLGCNVERGLQGTGTRLALS